VRRLRQGQTVSDQSSAEPGTSGTSPAARIALKVSAMHADLLSSLHEEIGTNGGSFADAAQRLAGEFGSVTAAAVDAAQGEGGRTPMNGNAALVPEQIEELPSLYQPGHMRRRLEQLLETNRRYGHPFGLAVFDASGPGIRPGDVAGGQETVLSTVGAALRDSIRIVDEAFRLEEDALCVLAPNIGTVEGVQMCERLLGALDDLERAGGLRISISAGVVACPDHGAEADELLHKADAAMWRARAVGQPVGVGALQDR
ncbi:MAG TPA: GGDEF domain-containing protein, partial [Solirubrobacterales bacterium]|nr:GGDEF domain-containing protein [Solirubrobacterales bacterium]